jgi:hypothetical protein
LFRPFLGLALITVILFLSFVVDEAKRAILPLLRSFFTLFIIVEKLFAAAFLVILF